MASSARVRFATGSICCEPLDIITERGAMSAKPSGLCLESTFSLSGKPSRKLLVLHFPRRKRGKDKFDRATWAEVNYCPFCGTKVSQ